MEKQLKNKMEHAMKHIAEEINSIEDDHVGIQETNIFKNFKNGKI